MFSTDKPKYFIPPFLVILYGIVVVNSAWICDDAFISLRTVDNFVNGYGLCWNVAEHVQTFTNPLWTLLLSGIYAVTNEAYYTTILFSIAVSLCGVVFLLYKATNRDIYALVLSVLLLCASKAFVDYSTSGLENPLLHLFIVLFYWIYFASENNYRKLFWLCLIASLSIFNRMDSVLLFAPALLYSSILLPEKLKNKKQFIYALSGLLPFILWEFFALIYYGFPFPDTAYAKLNTGIPVWELVVQGFYYLFDSLTRDPITRIAITACGVIVFLKKDKKSIIAFVGVSLYLLYILKIGGDFMSGRFLAAPFYVSVVILTIKSRDFLNLKKVSAVYGTILLIAFLNPANPMRTGRSYNNRTINEKGIADERGWYYQGTGLLVSAEVKNRLVNNTYLVENLGMKYKKESREIPTRVVGNAGYIGYYSGPDVHLIDILGLSDPFIARLKPDLNSGWSFGLPSKTGWRIGHFFRHLPEGYFESRLHKKNVLQNQQYAELYNKLALITQGEIFSVSRFKEIWKFNTGQYASALNSQ